MPVQGGVRRRRTTAPKLSQVNSDSTIVSYNANGRIIKSTGANQDFSVRIYIPGYSSSELQSSAGINVAKSYSTGKFLPGTNIRWEPACSFTTPGRVYVAFSDNPEVIVNMLNYGYADYVNAVIGMGNAVSFPVWQETQVNFPTSIRRKRFDVNENVSIAVDVLDRSAQVAMFVATVGLPSDTVAGNFWYHDKLSVEGLKTVNT